MSKPNMIHKGHEGHEGKSLVCFVAFVDGKFLLMV